ncbi:alpha/beta hydrolase-fold protein [Blautia schinkii]|nr:alpha/beta hydrolase-fold protein [Blautia schinkii]
MFNKKFYALTMAAVMCMSVPVSAAAAESTPADEAATNWEEVLGPTVTKSEDSPTGYMARFVYKDEDAESVQFHGDMALQNWEDQSDTTKYSPFEYKPGMMRGAGSYDEEMEEVADGYWMIEVPITAGANQYWFTVNGVDEVGGDWLIDPANPYAPKYPADCLEESDRRNFNPVYVHYDAETMGDFEPLAARDIEVPREDIDHGSWSYVELPAEINEGENAPEKRYLGVYLPPSYDAEREEPYKTIYLQHGSGQDASDWLNIGSVPHIMDNLIADGETEPAIVVTTMASSTSTPGYLGEGNKNIPEIIKFVEDNYNVADGAENRSFSGLSMGGSITSRIMASDMADLFKYYGVWSGGMVNVIDQNIGEREPDMPVPEENLQDIYVFGGQGNHDLPAADLSEENVEAFYNRVPNGVYLEVAGGHDFNTWNQLFATYAKDYLWNPDAFAAK